MHAATPHDTTFVYVHTDVPEGQTLREWRRERERQRRAERSSARRVRLPRWRFA